MSLHTQKCIPCEGGVLPLTVSEAEQLLRKVPSWTLSSDAKKITKTYTFRNFSEALAFTNRVGAVAEEKGHHPDIALSWGRVVVTLSTHAIHGLSVNDFILAASIDAM